MSATRLTGPALTVALTMPGAAAANGFASELPAVVVTATATERQLDDAPASISVVTREQLQQRPVMDLSDAVRGSTGVTVGGIGLGRRGIRIRGMDSEYTLVLVDGRRINAASDAIAHADFDLGWMPAEAIERIEIVRGPMSSLYGSEALGGVVNVITRSATDHWLGSATVNGGRVAGDLGGDTWQAGVYAGGPLVDGVLGVSFQAESRRKEASVDPADDRLTEQEGRDADNGSLTLSWTPDDAQRIDLAHLEGREERWRDALQSGGPAYVYETRDHIERSQTSLTHRGTWAWGDSVLRAYRSTLDRDNTRSRGEPTRPQRLREDIVDGHVSAQLGLRHRLSVGGEWRREELDDATVNALAHAASIQRALFVQDEIELAPDASLVLGDRADHHPQFGWHHSPRAYVVWHPHEAWTLKGGVGSGFKAPTLKQLSPQYSAVGGGGRFTIYGNPDLKPETATSYELGATRHGTGWSLGATAFHNELEDLIQTICVSACGVRGREVRNYVNVAEARLRGVELNGQLDLSPQLQVDANYTWLQARDRTTGLPLNERPQHSGAATLAWMPTPALRAALRSEYVGTQWQLSGTQRVRLPAYMLWSLDVGYRISERLSVRASIENLADERLDERSALYPYPETGRYYNVGLTLGF